MNSPSGTFEINVSLEVYNFECSVEEISGILQAEPTRTMTRGEPIAKTILRRKSNRWVLDSGAPASAALAVHLEALLVRMPDTRSFTDLPGEAEVQFLCVIYDRNRSVPLMFPANFVRAAAAIGAEINVDYYDLGIE